jgi:thermitase
MVKSQKMFISPAAGTFAVNDKAQFEAVYGKGPFEFTSSAPTVASVDSNGMMTALAEGQTTISVKDSTGASSTSYKIFVGKAGGGGGGGGGTPAPDPGNPPGGGGECPIGDPQMCQIICQVMPDAPWCKTR